ncbi:MAG: hypothetical protein KIT69_15320 [Propionibacteriaceae bacterium]|nr:hypothetical protein [Propionibacteriaceae bacterium]
MTVRSALNALESSTQVDTITILDETSKKELDAGRKWGKTWFVIDQEYLGGALTIRVEKADAEPKPRATYPKQPKMAAKKPVPAPKKGSRVGAICRDGWDSSATGRGACSHHGGVRTWVHEVVNSDQIQRAKDYNKKVARKHNEALKKWKQAKKAIDRDRSLVKKFPCTSGPYHAGEPGYAEWRDTNHNGIACDVVRFTKAA